MFCCTARRFRAKVVMPLHKQVGVGEAFTALLFILHSTLLLTALPGPFHIFALAYRC